MDVRSNAAVSSNLVDDFLPWENMEGGGVSLEWLSNFVEECLNGQGFTTQLPLPTTPIPNPTTNHRTPNPEQLPQKAYQKDLSISTSTPIPSKARTKRRKTNNFQLVNVNLNANSSDPTLLPQAYWLADSELLNFPKKQQQQQQQQDEEDPPQLKLKVKEEEEEGEGGKMVHPRRCTHCGSYKTPQWRAGPLGPKTLCNACGVRFKSGRLLPEYRPAKSPTFESFKHSNSHKKVMEMRMATLLSSPSN